MQVTPSVPASSGPFAVWIVGHPALPASASPSGPPASCGADAFGDFVPHAAAIPQRTKTALALVRFIVGLLCPAGPEDARRDYSQNVLATAWYWASSGFAALVVAPQAAAVVIVEGQFVEMLVV